MTLEKNSLKSVSVRDANVAQGTLTDQDEAWTVAGISVHYLLFHRNLL